MGGAPFGSRVRPQRHHASANPSSPTSAASGATQAKVSRRDRVVLSASGAPAMTLWLLLVLALDGGTAVVDAGTPDDEVIRELELLQNLDSAGDLDLLKEL